MNGDMPSNSDETSLKSQIASFRKSDDARQHLLEKLIQENERLHARQRDISNDLANEAASRRTWQNKFNEINNDLELIRRQTDTSLFALALIDGDGAIFQEHLLKAGADGGSEAGYLLYNDIKKHLLQRHETISNWSIMVQIFANFEGLSRKLASVGIIKSPADLHTFARAFSCSQPLFSFIDVGSGKERADHKIKEMLRLFMFNAQCKHITFGGSHDNGYLPNLEPYKRDTSITDKFSLLATTAPEPGFLSLGMQITRFSSVFRNDPLPDRYMVERTLSGPNPAPQPVVPLTSVPKSNGTTPPPPSQPQVGLPTPKRKSSSSSPTEQAAQPSQPAPIPHRSNSENRPIAKVSTVSSSSSQQTKASGAGSGDSGSTPASASTSKIVAEKQNKSSKAIYLNGSDQRVDLTLPRPETTAVNALNARIKERKVCNNFHLLKHCSTGINCYFSHEPLPASQVNALRVKARERQCGQSSDCRDFNCFSGHMCPRGADCNVNWCTFDDDSHYIEKEIKMKYYESGEVELVR